MEGRHCRFWLPKKRRFCANSPIPTSPFCGNHNPSTKEERVPCPIDPSHSVFERNLDSHLKRCPLLKRVADLESQPFYRKGINSGGGEIGASSFVSSEEKRRAVLSSTVAEFCCLVRKIRSIRSSISTEIRDSYSMPEACSIWMDQMRARQLPFQEKHALQQASILGNLESLGALENAARSKMAVNCDGWMEEGDKLSRYETDGAPAVVEFGAGRGYLTHMLADCYGARKVFFVERRSYKLKADRSLRQDKNVNIHRLRIDIEDLDLNAVEHLKEDPYLAIGKHLCGPATDLTLRCCLLGHDSEVGGNIPHSLKGLAVATCCHHLCQWEQYTNKKFLEDMGINKDDFHAITWFSSWAVDADHSSDLLSSINEGSFQKNEATQTDGGDKDVEGVIRSWKAVDRAAFGFLCKEIIDMGRLLWLKERGLDAHLVNYVPYSISPENHLLVATSGAFPGANP